jgi:osmoprotectant transport system substrate-binding protein
MQRSTQRARAGLVAAMVTAGAVGISACGSSTSHSQNGSSGLQTATAGDANGGPTTSPSQSISSAASAASTSSTSTTSSATSSQPGKGKPTFVMGDKNFPEEYILGDLYQQALEAQGYTVKLKPNIGSTEVTFKALSSGQIQGYPEYDGTLLASVANDSTMYSSAAATAKATQSWATQHGYVFSTATPFTDSDAIATTTAYAKKNGLTSIGDLKKLGKSVKLAGAPEFATRSPDGLLGLEKFYGAKPTFNPSSIGSFYPLLDKGEDTAAAVFTTDPPLKSGKYTVLSDPKGIFGYQNVGIVAKASVVKAEGPAFLQTINKVSALLTQKAIISLNAAVEQDQQPAATVAKAFLKANHLL